MLRDSSNGSTVCGSCCDSHTADRSHHDSEKGRQRKRKDQRISEDKGTSCGTFLLTSVILFNLFESPTSTVRKTANRGEQ